MQLPSSEEILARAYCVPTSFALAARHARAHADLDVFAHAAAHPTSLLARVMVAAGVARDTEV